MKGRAIKLLSGLLLNAFLFTNLQGIMIVQASENDTTEKIIASNVVKDNPLSEEDAKEIGKHKNSLNADGDTENLGENKNLNHSTTNPIVILIKFKGQSDEEAFPTQKINDLKEAFSGQEKSFKNYLETASYGQCSVNPQFIFEQNKGIYIYEAPYTKEYYMPYDEVKNPIGYTNKADRQQLLIDAFVSIKDRLSSDINYDINNDGYYDGVDFVVPESGEWDGFLWSHRWSVNDSNNVTTKNGCTLKDYNLITATDFPKTDYTMITHEYLHVLGYPDFYVYNNEGSFDNPMDNCSIMASYGGYQSVYERMAYSNWISKDDIKTISSEAIYKLDNFAKDPKNNNIAYKINVPNSNQYFMIEYRDKDANEYTKELNQSGIVVYRIDEDRNGNSTGDPEIYALRNENNETTSNKENEITKLVLSTGEETGYMIQYIQVSNGQAYFKLIKYTPNQGEINIKSANIYVENDYYTFEVNADDANQDLRYTYYLVDESNNEELLISNSKSNYYSSYILHMKFHIKAVVSDGKGNIAKVESKEINKNCIESINVNDDKSINFGDTVNVSIDLLNDKNPKDYHYEIKASVGEVAESIATNESELKYNWTPKQTGRYTIVVKAYNKLGQLVDEKTIEAVVTDKIMLNMSKNSPAEVGDKITLTAGNDYIKNNKYRFSVIYDNKKSFLSTFSTKNNIVWNPKEEGKYTLIVEMLDEMNVITKKTIQYDIIKTHKIESIDLPSNPISIGEEIIATVNTKYDEDYTYSMSVCYYGNKIQDYGIVDEKKNDKVLAWKPDKIGQYQITVTLKYKEITVDENYLYVNVNKKLNPKINISKVSPQGINTPIYLSASSDVSEGVQYRYILYRNGKVEAISSCKEKLNIRWIPRVSGEYVIKLQCRDSNGYIESVTQNYSIINPIKINNIIINDGQDVGYYGNNTKVKISINTDGGDGSNKYYVTAEKYGYEDIVVSNSDSSVAEYYLNEYVNNIKIKVIVIDKNGSYDVAYKNVSIVNEEPTFNISPEKSGFFGDSFTLSARPYTEGDYEYRFSVAYGKYIDYQYTYDEVEYLSEFNKNSAISWKPNKLGRYKVMAELKDKSGKIISKADYVSVVDSEEMIFTKVNIQSNNKMAAKSPIKLTPEVKTKGKIIKYEYTIYGSNLIKPVSVVSTKDSVIWNPAKPGHYVAVVKAYNEYGSVATHEEDFDIINTITIDSFISEKDKNNINFYCNAYGDGNIYYRYLIYKDDKLIK